MQALAWTRFGGGPFSFYGPPLVRELNLQALYTSASACLMRRSLRAIGLPQRGRGGHLGVSGRHCPYLFDKSFGRECEVLLVAPLDVFASQDILKDIEPKWVDCAESLEQARELMRKSGPGAYLVVSQANVMATPFI